jgi:hypothetical protein
MEVYSKDMRDIAITFGVVTTVLALQFAFGLKVALLSAAGALFLILLVLFLTR